MPGTPVDLARVGLGLSDKPPAPVRTPVPGPSALKPRTPAAPPPPADTANPLTWDEVLDHPDMKNLSGEQLEAARRQYFSDVVSPHIAADQVDAAWQAFDADTSPSIMAQVKRGASRLLDIGKQTVKGGSVPSPAPNSPPTTQPVTSPAPAPTLPLPAATDQPFQSVKDIQSGKGSMFTAEQQAQMDAEDSSTKALAELDQAIASAPTEHERKALEAERVRLQERGQIDPNAERLTEQDPVVVNGGKNYAAMTPEEKAVFDKANPEPQFGPVKTATRGEPDLNKLIAAYSIQNNVSHDIAASEVGGIQAAAKARIDKGEDPDTVREWAAKQYATPTGSIRASSPRSAFDYLYGLASGINTLLATPIGLANAVTGGGYDTVLRTIFGKSGTQLATDIDKYLTGQMSDQTLSEKYNLSGTTGGVNVVTQLLQNPKLLAQVGIESAPSTLGLLGITRGAVIKAYATAEKAALDAGRSQATAASLAREAATNAGEKANIIANGLMGAGQNALQTKQQVMAMPEPDLEKSPIYAWLRKYVDVDTAREVTANLAAEPSAVIAGFGDALATRVSGAGKSEAQIMGGKSIKDKIIAFRNAPTPEAIGSIVRPMANEAKEEFLQSGPSEQGGQNVGVKLAANPDQPLGDQVVEQGALGATLAVGQTAGMHAAGAMVKPLGKAEKPAERAHVEPTLNTEPEVKGREANVASMPANPAGPNEPAITIHPPVITPEAAAADKGQLFHQEPTLKTVPEVKAVTEPAAAKAAKVEDKNAPIPASEVLGEPEVQKTQSSEPLKTPEIVKQEPVALPPAVKTGTPLAVPEYRTELETMAKNAGWHEVGGKMIRDEEGNVTGRTSWIPKEDWWPGRPDKLNPEQVQEAVRKAIAGEPLKAAEKRTVDYMLDSAQQRIHAAKSLSDVGLPVTDQNIVDHGLSERAAILDPDKFERLSLQYTDDDAAFMKGVREIIDGNESAKTGAGGEADHRAQASGQSATEAQVPPAQTGQEVKVYNSRLPAMGQAAQLKKRTGQAYEAVPHPTEAGKWIVRVTGEQNADRVREDTGQAREGSTGGFAAVQQGAVGSRGDIQLQASGQPGHEQTGPGGAGAQGHPPALKKERRSDLAKRKAVAEMSAEEMRHALLASEVTGLGNRRAYDEAPKKPVQVSVDADSLKWVNDTMGHETGDKLLRLIGEAMADEGADAYHLSGDEFAVQADHSDHAIQIMNGVRDRLSKAVLEFKAPDGRIITLNGIGVSYGAGQTLGEADRHLQQDKQARELSGARAGRGLAPPRSTQKSAQRLEADQSHPPAERVNPQTPSKEGVSTSATPAPTQSTEASAPKGAPATAEITGEASGAQAAAGKEVERFAGQYGKGLTEWNAKRIAKERAAKTPTLDWRVTPAPEFGPDRFAVVGHEFPVDTAAHEAAASPLNDKPAPTTPQILAGNAELGHPRINGLDISVENPVGSIREDKHHVPPKWRTEMKSHYGYVVRVDGKTAPRGVDKEHIDVFIKPGTPEDYNGPVFVIDQKKIGNGHLDEHKAMIGYPDEKAARVGYLENYSKGWDGIRAITPMSMEQFKTWLKEGDTTQPAASVEPAGTITDFGEKIGGARKDTARPTGAKASTETADSAEPGWRKRFQVYEIASSMRPEEVGRWAISDKRVKGWQGDRVGRETFPNKEAAEAALPLLAVAQKHRVFMGKPNPEGVSRYSIWREVTDRKRVQVMPEEFATREDGLRYMADHAAEIIETKTSFGEEILAKPDTVQRTGEAHRTGPATKEMFGDTFGFRGVEFGNWNNQEERQVVMDHAYDGLLDLAEVLGVPAKAISLNGELALAFGARGQGLSGAKAHYERDYGVINLTKMTGAGSLAHEWFHALDHYLGRQDTKAKSEKIKNELGDMVYEASSPKYDFASHGFRVTGSKVREELRKVYTDLIQTMFTKAEQYVEDTQKAEKFVGASRENLAKALAAIRAGLTQGPEQLHYMKRNNKPASTEQLAAFDQLADRLVSGEDVSTTYRPSPQAAGKKIGAPGWMAGRHTNDTLEEISAILKAVRGRNGFSAEGHGPLDGLRSLMLHYSQRINMLKSANTGEEKTKRVPTSYAMENKKIDQGRASDYWTTEHEMAARAFSAYVEDKIAEQGNRSDFLAYGADNNLPWYRIFNVRPFPEGKERIDINKAFDKFVALLETKETDKGVALFSRGTGAGMSSDDVNAAVAPIRAAAKNLPQVNVLPSSKQAPEALRADIKKNNAENDVAGAFHDGQVYLFADQIKSPEHAQFVLLHEATHFGLRGLFGPEIDPVLMQIWMTNPEIRKQAAERMAKFDLSRVRAVEEVLADMGGNKIQPTVWQKLVAFVRNWLRKNGFTAQFVKNLNDADVTSILQQASAYWKKGEGKTATHLYRDAALSRNAKPFYWHGDRAEYTGATREMHGGLFHEVKLVEGHLNGETKWTQQAPTFALQGETEAQIKVKEQAAAKAEAEKAKEPSAKKMTGDQLDLFNTQSTLFSRTSMAEVAKNGLRRAVAPAAGQSGTKARYKAIAQRVIDFTDRLANPLVDLPGQRDYLKNRQVAMGVIGSGNDVVKEIRNVFADATPEDRRAAYDFFTTEGATAAGIRSETVRNGVQTIKDAINHVSDQLVDKGVISADAREEFRDRYLPQLYLRHLLEDNAWKSMGAGKKTSDMGYAKARKLEQFRNAEGEIRLRDKETGKALSDEEVLKLGPVTDPEFLASVALARPMRDMAILDWLESISKDERWVLQNTTMQWNGKRVSPYFLKTEADRLRRQAGYYEPEAGKRANAYADRMDAAANKALESLPAESKGFTQIPNTGRYGAMRGIWVRTEIYHDLVGNAHFQPNDMNWFQNLFGVGGVGAKATSMWKGTKTYLNPSGQVRNFVTNMTQLQLSGVPFHSLPSLLTRTVGEMKDKGQYFQEFKAAGGEAGTFANEDLGRMQRELLDMEHREGSLSTWGKLHRAAAIVTNKAGDIWQANEVLGKLMKFTHERERGASPADAMIEANKTLFDYSLVQPWIRYARSVPFGIPFATWAAKILPRLVETALLHPVRYLPYVAMYYGAQYALAHLLGVGYDDLEKLRKAMPQWLWDKKNAVLMPWKDSHGRWQVMDMSYFMPWTQWAQLGSDLAGGKISNVLQDIGAFGGPIPNIVSAISTQQDPFTHRDIANKGDPPGEQAWSWLNYAWSLAAPPFLTDTGATGHALRAYTGTTNKFGDPLDTGTQAALRFMGVNMYALTPEQTRAANLQHLEVEARQSLTRLKQRSEDRSLSTEKRDALENQYRAEIMRRGMKMRDYSEESAIHPRLSTGH